MGLSAFTAEGPRRVWVGSLVGELTSKEGRKGGREEGRGGKREEGRAEGRE